MSAVDDAMSGVAMQLCDAVTAILNGDGQVRLLGVKRGVYSSTLTNDEEVVNTHFIREARWQADCGARQHGGSQSIWFPNGDDVPLKYDATKYKLFIKCCNPTPKKVKTIPIQWIDSHNDDLEIDSGTKPVCQEPVSLSLPIIKPVGDSGKDPPLKPVENPTQQAKKKEQDSTSNISTSLTQEVPEKK
eukprot:12004285-Ditylum_brightwellii.AAC.1